MSILTSASNMLSLSADVLYSPWCFLCSDTLHWVCRYIQSEQNFTSHHQSFIRSIQLTDTHSLTHACVLTYTRVSHSFTKTCKSIKLNRFASDFDLRENVSGLLFLVCSYLHMPRARARTHTPPLFSSVGWERFGLRMTGSVPLNPVRSRHGSLMVSFKSLLHPWNTRNVFQIILPTVSL